MVSDLFFFVPFAAMLGIFLTFWLEDRERAPARDRAGVQPEAANRRRSRAGT
jgi:hypothetical protein